MESVMNRMLVLAAEFDVIPGPQNLEDWQRRLRRFALEVERELAEARAAHLAAGHQIIDLALGRNRLREAIATYIGKVEAGTDDPNALVDLAREQQALA